MNSNNLDYQRRCAVSKAWSNERKNVMQSRGSRNWSLKEQREIIATGRCHGYEGQHMLSVKSHPEYAGNENNIQFLTHEEHFQAHGGNWKNNANGRFNLKTKKVDDYNGEVPKISYHKLSDPLPDRAKKIANTKYQNSKKQNINAHKDVKSIDKNKRIPVNKVDKKSNTEKNAKSRELFKTKVSTKDNKKDYHSSKIKNNNTKLTIKNNHGTGII